MYKLHSIYSYIKAVTLRVNQPVILGGGEIVQAAVGEDAKLFCIPIMNGYFAKKSNFLNHAVSNLFPEKNQSYPGHIPIRILQIMGKCPWKILT